MLQAFDYKKKLILNDSRYSHSAPSSYRGFHSLVLVLVFLVAACLGILFYAPEMLGDARKLVPTLMVLLVASVVIFALTILYPGRIAAAIFDASHRSADFIRSGTFASTTRRVPFEKITAVRMAVQYDDLGGKSMKPVVELKNQETLPLPEGTDWSDLVAIRKKLSDAPPSA